VSGTAGNRLWGSRVQRRREKLVRSLAEKLAEEDRQLTGPRGPARPGRKPERLLPGDDGPAEAEADAESAAFSKTRNISPPAAIVRHHRLGRSSLEEAILETYHAHMSLHEVEEVIHELWDGVVSAAAICEFQSGIANRIRAWLGRPLAADFPYLFVETILLAGRAHRGTPPARVLAAVGVDALGYREVLAVGAPGAGPPDDWLDFLRGLKARGLQGVRLIIGPGRADLAAAVDRQFPGARLQASLPQFWLDVAGQATGTQVYPVTELLRRIHATEDEREAHALADAAGAKLQELGLREARAALDAALEPTFSYFRFPRKHWRYLRSNDLLRRVARVVRERTRVLGSVNSGDGAVLAVAAHLRQIARSTWQQRRFLDMADLGPGARPSLAEAAGHERTGTFHHP